MTRTCKCGTPLGPRNTIGVCNNCKGGLNRIPLPSDFAARAGDMTNDEAVAVWGVSKNTIGKWRKETKTPAPVRKVAPANYIKVPADFARVAPTKNLRELTMMYGVSGPTIRRMCAESGVDFYRPAYQRSRNKLVVMANMGKRNVAAAQVAPQNRDMSLAGRAADFLQKRSAIWRCDAQGRFKLGGSHWRWKGEARTADFIIAEAIRLGFQPDARKEIAA